MVAKADLLAAGSGLAETFEQCDIGEFCGGGMYAVAVIHVAERGQDFSGKTLGQAG